MGLFAPPDLFCAVGLAARGDPDLPDGVHLRLMPSPALGFPIAPFGIYRVQPYVAEPQVLWRDRAGKILTEPALDAAGGVLIADLAHPVPEGDVVDVAVELVAEHFDGTLELLDRAGNRVIATRSRRPYIVGGPRVDRVRIQGRGRVLALRTWRVDLQHILEPILGQAPVALLSLPIDGSLPWYGKGLGSGAALDNVKRGAALRLQAPDRPDGPLDPLTPNDDVARVSVHLDDIVKQCVRMVRDIDRLPRTQRLVRVVPVSAAARRQSVNIGIADTLLVQAMDPGIGRCLGLVGTVDEQTDGTRPLAYVAIGLFAFRPGAIAPDGRTLGTSMGPRPAVLDRIETMLAERVGAQSVLQGLGERYFGFHGAAFIARVPLEIRGLLAVAAAVPPADPPRLPGPVLGDAHWQEGQGGPSTSFRQEFLFPAPPLGSLVALGRRDNGAWDTRHQTVTLPPPASPQNRALAMLLGRTQAKPRIVRFVKALGSYMRRGLIADAPISSLAAPVRYRAALADLFGRFGAPVEFDVPAPERPRPPAPAPQVKLVLDGPEGVGGPPASPGHIDVEVTVPSVAALAAGSLDIASLALAFDGAALPSVAFAPIAAGTSLTTTKRIDLPALAVGIKSSGKLTASFVDTAGQPSEIVTHTVAYGDRRRPHVVPTGLGLIWTSRPGPSPEVELKLAWPGDPALKYRAYIADAKSLALAGTTRADVALQGGVRDRAGNLGGRDRFRLLTDPPLEVVAGRVTLNERLPRALTTVQFVRIVPVTGQGREAEFDACGVVPVAVPTDRSPPQPRVDVRVDPLTGVATVSVEALGLDLSQLEAQEPGLFSEPPSPGAVAPEYRIKRASGSVPDPAYAREIARGSLVVARDGDETRFRVEVDDPSPLGPFVRYSYWAEVRMPPERRIPQGVVELPPAGGVGPVVAAQVAAIAPPYSASSAPASVLHAPSPPVPPLAGANAGVIAEAGTRRASLVAPATPFASPKAVGTYRLRIWEQWGDTSITLATPDSELDGSALAWEGASAADADHPLPLTLHVAVIDPIGRQSNVVALVAP